MTDRRTPGADTLSFARHSWAGLRVLLVLTVLLGVVYPLAVTGVAQLTMRWQANGSLVSSSGERVTSADEAIGSVLIGQQFDGPQWFHPRPSAAGDGYDTLASAGSNLGPLNADLLATVTQRRADVAAAEGVDPSAVPVDAVTASGSGLDPDISPAYAQLQVARVARERGVPALDVAALVENLTLGRDLGVLGEPRVDVLRLNLALQTLDS
ncbi:potassium-transporting ATPase subunit KdpC [Cellulomonas rhizosphaerae]|uniref:Potassium-transporting ATPase KdpC subunit n=1 Tax=Cellulomonas rhizosphaerae TaxID=2293719 RepID=A0A413RJE7_9CELL|nr:potassium-transporting ATPase subunit KdpC [Cellulomonas rhizosphaerae]RHA38618.1 potassium-transporting ATPase subunit KdpC [Cellulomonas rhizosphaerae]